MDMDSDNDNDLNDRDENEVNLTGFLFGNIDSEGRLEDDIFDNESKRQLAALARFVFSKCESCEILIDLRIFSPADWDSTTYWK